MHFAPIVEVKIHIVFLLLRCYFKSNSELTVGVGRSPSLTYKGDNISLAAGAFSLRGQILADSSLLMDLFLASPSIKVTPVAVISGSSVYSICDRVWIHGRGSTGDGGNGLTYIWGIEFASSVNIHAVSASDNSSLAALQIKLSAMDQRRNGISFLASELASSLEYNVTLKVNIEYNLYFEMDNMQYNSTWSSFITTHRLYWARL